MFDIKKLGDDVLKGQITSLQRDIKALNLKLKDFKPENKDQENKLVEMEADLKKQKAYLHDCCEEAKARGWKEKSPEGKGAKGKDKKDGEGETPKSYDPPTKE